jgi:hypothetical protein
MEIAMWRIEAELDRKASERAVAGGTFKVISLFDDEDNDLTDLVDQDANFASIEDLKDAILQSISERLIIQEVEAI